jgi:lycopene beta-cyclase
MNEPAYDFIIVGGGAAGLSLAYHLVNSPLRERSILIVDKDAKNRNDRTWCFWSNQPTLFDGIAHRSWSQLRVAGETFEKTVDLQTYRYRMIRGIDFYRFGQRELAAHTDVRFLQGNVQTIEDGGEQATVTVDGQTYAGRWVFDSRFKLSQFRPDAARYHYLQQHFRGWEIETTTTAFDPQVATFMDFRSAEKQGVSFFYVLPFSERHALVEYVLHSHHAAPYSQTLRAYLETTLGIEDYRIVSMEGGINPLTDQPFPRRVGRRIMSIGIPGGRVKPTSGYAFWRIQQDSAAIVRSLLRAEHPFDVPPDSRFFHLCDSLMLQIMDRHSDQVEPIFAALFENNPSERVLRFLDEAASLWESLSLIATLPPALFLQALFQLKVLGGVQDSPSIIRRTI